MFGERQLTIQQMSKIAEDFQSDYGHLLIDERIQGITVSENDRNKVMLYICATNGYEKPAGLPEKYQGLTVQSLEVGIASFVGGS